MAGTNKRTWPAARLVLLALAAAFLANACWLALTANLTVGTAMTALVGAGLLAWGGWYRRTGRAVTVAAVALAVGFGGLSVFLAAYGSRSTATDDEAAAIVLGAAVHGSELSRTLQGRLDAAVAYHQRNPKALIVVSGGQGPQENLPEGVAMAAYLRTQGVPDDLIVVEDKATSTEENFALSKALLDQRLAPGYRVVLITDEFHVYRASRIAASQGLTATGIGQQTPWYFWPANYLREDLVVIRLWLTGS